MMAALTLDTVPVGGFVQLAGGRAHEGLDDEQFHALVQTVMNKEGGGGVAAQILGMRIFGRRSDKLPISESLKATGRDFLSKVELEKGTQLDHMIGEVIEVAFDKSEYEEEARAFCARIIASLKGWEVYGGDLGEIITALTKTFPIVILNMLVEQAAGEDCTGRTIFQDIRSNRACPLDVMPDEVWMTWAAQTPETR